MLYLNEQCERILRINNIIDLRGRESKTHHTKREPGQGQPRVASLMSRVSPTSPAHVTFSEVSRDVP